MEVRRQKSRFFLANKFMIAFVAIISLTISHQRRREYRQIVTETKSSMFVQRGQYIKIYLYTYHQDLFLYIKI